jgi:hypothetical protein
MGNGVARIVTRLQLSIAVGLVCAVLLTLIRGGWRDAPYVVPIFATLGFTITYGIASMIQSDRLAAIETASSRHGGLMLLRDAAAVVFLGFSLYCSGYLVQEAGFGGWLVALLFGVLLPLVVCLVASRAPIIFGVLAATSLVFSILLHDFDIRHNPLDREAWSRVLYRDWAVWAILWAILTGLSLLVSVPLAIRRRRMAAGADSAE